MTDGEWIRRIKLGDERAAEELIRHYYPCILRYCRRHCYDRERAEDLTQETFLRLFKSLPQYQEQKNFKAYLYTIANHLCVDESRRFSFCPSACPSADVEAADECSELSRIEDRAEIDYLLRVLSPEQREAVLLRFEEQLSYREIAHVMGCNMRTAQSRVQCALKLMKKNYSADSGKEVGK